MKRENKEQKEKKWLGRCFSSLFFTHPFFFFFTRFQKMLFSLRLCKVCGCFKASVQKAQINPTAYVFRNYHVC